MQSIVGCQRCHLPVATIVNLGCGLHFFAVRTGVEGVDATTPFLTSILDGNGPALASAVRTAFQAASRLTSVLTARAMSAVGRPSTQPAMTRRVYSTTP